MKKRYSKFFKEVSSSFVSINGYIKNLRSQGMDEEKIKTLIVNRFNLNNNEADKYLNG